MNIQLKEKVIQGPLLKILIKEGVKTMEYSNMLNQVADALMSHVIGILITDSTLAESGRMVFLHTDHIKEHTVGIAMLYESADYAIDVEASWTTKEHYNQLAKESGLPELK